MNPLLITPAAAAVANVAHSGFSTATGTLAGAANAADFQRYASILQGNGGVDANQLIGMKQGDLQQKISSLSASQQITLAQQLMGGTVSVVNGSGQVIKGTAEKLQIEGGVPVFQVAGQSYTLSQITSVVKTNG
jgi:hypothetical protein